MTKASVRRLRSAIEDLPRDRERDYPGKWYRSQHWLGWLREYGRAGAYGRKVRGKGAEYAYNHIVESEMLLWLARAAGVPRSALEKARIDAHNAKSMPGRSKAVRRNVPWSMISKALWHGTAA